MYVVLEIDECKDVGYCGIFETSDLAISAANARLSALGVSVYPSMFSLIDFDIILRYGYTSRNYLDYKVMIVAPTGNK
jgi:hypothetical protein